MTAVLPIDHHRVFPLVIPPAVRSSFLRASVLIVLLGLVHHAYAQPLCDPLGNVILYSNYDGGYLTINVDENVADLKIGITSYEAVQVDIVGPFAGNVTEVVFAGFGGLNNAGCGPLIPAVTVNGVAPGIVTIYSARAGDVPIATHLGDVFGGVSLVNCIVSGDVCGQLNTGGGNSSPQIAAFFLDVFGPGAVLRSHWTDYTCFPGAMNVSDGGNCCLFVPSGEPNPIYVSGDAYSFFPDDTLLCGPSITLNAGAIYPLLVQPPAYTGYLWSTGATGPSITVTEPGTYWFTATDYCHTDIVSNYLSDTIVVLACCGVEADVLVTPITCAGANDGILEATSTGAGPFTYSWNTVPAQNVALINGLGPGTYTVVVSDGVCDTAMTRVLADPLPLQVQVFGPASICAGNPTELEVDVAGGNAPYTYAWSSGGTAALEVVAPLVDTTFDVIVTDSTGCSNTASLSVVAEPAPLATIAVGDTVCANQPTLLQAFVAGADSLAWNWGLDGFSEEPAPLALFTTSGWNQVTFQPFIAGGCPGPIVRDSVFVLPQANALLLVDPIPCSLEVRFLLQAQGADSCALYLNDSLLVNTCDGFVGTQLAGPGPFQIDLYAIRTDGCNDTLSQLVVPAEEPLLYLPNAFTPNGDGINDGFPGVVFQDEGPYRMRIFDRWGREMWTTENPAVQWDGLSSGTEVPVGVYAVEVERRDPCREGTLLQFGHVVLVR